AGILLIVKLAGDPGDCFNFIVGEVLLLLTSLLYRSLDRSLSTETLLNHLVLLQFKFLAGDKILYSLCLFLKVFILLFEFVGLPLLVFVSLSTSLSPTEHIGFGNSPVIIHR